MSRVLPPRHLLASDGRGWQVCELLDGTIHLTLRWDIRGWSFSGVSLRPGYISWRRLPDRPRTLARLSRRSIRRGR